MRFGLLPTSAVLCLLLGVMTGSTPPVLASDSANPVTSKPTIRFFEIAQVPRDFQLKCSSDLEAIKKLPESPVKNMDSGEIQLGRDRWFHLILGEPKDSSSLDSQNTTEPLILYMKGAHSSLIRATLVLDGEIVDDDQAGYRIPLSERKVVSADLIFRLNAWKDWAHTPADVYIQLNSTSKMPNLTSLMTNREVSSGQIIDTAIVSIYIGILAILMMYQLFIYRTLNDIASLIYSSFCLTMILTAIARSGFFDMILGPYLGGFYLGDWMIYLIAINLFTAFQFLREYFNADKITPRIDRGIFWFMSGVLVLYIILTIARPSLLNKVVPTINLMVSFFAIGYAIYGVRKKFVGAGYYLLAWGGYVFFLSMYNMSLVGVLAMPPYMKYLTYFAGLWEAFMTSLGLSQRLSKFKNLEIETERRTMKNRSLHRLVQILCHDVANPLTVISASTAAITKLLPTPVDPAKISSKINRISQATQNINNIIEDVRTLEIVRTGKMKLQVSPVKIKDSLNNAKSNFEEKCQQKNISIVIDSKEDDLSVLAMPTFLENNVLSNIISNALKFSFPGDKINISLSEVDEWIKIDVRDYGIGIPNDLLKVIFSNEHATSRKGTHSESGTGFGMLLVKELVESFGGKVAVTSKTKEESPTDFGTQVSIFLINARN